MRALPAILITLQGSSALVLLARGLLRRYPALISYLLFSMVRGMVLARFSIYAVNYLDLWLVSLPLVTILQLAVAVEAYRNSLSELPGVRKFSHWVIAGLSAIAAAFAQLPQKTYHPWGFLSQINQGVGMALGLMALCMALLLTYVRPRRRKNAIVHERILALHFTGMAMLLAMVHLGATGWPSIANEVLSIACCLCWIVFLTPNGEQEPERPDAAASDYDLSSMRGRLVRLLRSS